MTPVRMQDIFYNTMERRTIKFSMPKPVLVRTRTNNSLFHKLKAGETLNDVAINYDNVSAIDIMQWNNINIKHPPRIGTRLIIKSAKD